MKSKIVNYEFWPAVIFYIPLVPYILYLIIRYKSFRMISLANPSFPLGGIVGESKNDILKKIDKKFIVKSFYIQKSDLKKMVNDFIKTKSKNNISIPLILKSDVGERGNDVYIINDIKKVEGIFQKSESSFILQEYHSGPKEVGVFYYRFPNQSMGDIYSITVKIFPEIIGDGVHTIEELILKHKRYSNQISMYRRNIANIKLVLNKGESYQLNKLGNHCKGSMFVDGRYLITEKLKQKIDAISKNINGFYFGRFDIRYNNDDDLMKGINFKIIELNGVTSESTNLYDPKFSIFQAYYILLNQWKILFKIGSINYNLGFSLPSNQEFFSPILNHFKKT